MVQRDVDALVSSSAAVSASGLVSVFLLNLLGIFGCLGVQELDVLAKGGEDWKVLVKSSGSCRR